MRYLRENADTLEGFRVSRLQHALIGATLAEAESGDIDWTVGYLLHDIGDALAPHNHGQIAAAVVRPFVREECHWVVQHHGIFQTVYYAHHVGTDPNARDRFRGHRHYHAAVEFCEFWDQRAFDPDLPMKPLEHFAPMVRDVFARPPFAADVLRPNVSVPLRRTTFVDRSDAAPMRSPDVDVG